MENTTPAPRRSPGGLRRFSRPLAAGVTLDDLVLPRAVTQSMPFTLNTATVVVGAELPLHSHSQHEIWVITAGSGRLDRGTETFDIGEGDVILFESQTQHHLTNTGQVDLQLVSVYWDPAR
ncbi:cupin domain-containing protein [Catellatospora sp. NPDC049111]|uniref:cupin domain-containing protein n=1 Tax=Catellatospora sp. NPDC049111 TaxID=3155271 RepID=UPI003407E7E8